MTYDPWPEVDDRLDGAAMLASIEDARDRRLVEMWAHGVARSDMAAQEGISRGYASQRIKGARTELRRRFMPGWRAVEQAEADARREARLRVMASRRSAREKLVRMQLAYTCMRCESPERLCPGCSIMLRHRW